MATKKTKGRLELRKEIEAAEKAGKTSAPAKAKAKPEGEKKKATKKPSKSKKKKVVVLRQRMVWGVFDNGNQQVATYPYTELEAAKQRAHDLSQKGRGGFFVQPVRQPIEEPEEEGAAEPAEAKEAAKKAPAKKEKASAKKPAAKK